MTRVPLVRRGWRHRTAGHRVVGTCRRRLRRDDPVPRARSTPSDPHLVARSPARTRLSRADCSCVSHLRESLLTARVVNALAGGVLAPATAVLARAAGAASVGRTARPPTRKRGPRPQAGRITRSRELEPGVSAAQSLLADRAELDDDLDVVVEFHHRHHGADAEHRVTHAAAGPQPATSRLVFVLGGELAAARNVSEGDSSCCRWSRPTLSIRHRDAASSASYICAIRRRIVRPNPAVPTPRDFLVECLTPVRAWLIMAHLKVSTY